MAFDTNKLNAYAFIRDFRASLGEKLQERLESGELFPVLEEGRSTKSFDSQDDAKKFADANHAKNPSKPVQGYKSGKWNVSVDEKSVEHGKGSQSTKTKGMFFGEGVEQLEEAVGGDTMDADWDLMGEIEKTTVVDLRAKGKMMGSDEGAYASGVLLLTFTNKQAVEDFAVALEDEGYVDTYEIEAVREDLINGFEVDAEYDFSNAMFDQNFMFNVFVYLVPEIVSVPAEELEIGDDFEWDDEADNGFITEVRRKIKVNFRGKKRIKMQCSPGFKWVASMRTCKKITGSQVAVMRKAMRRAVLTKKSLGQSFKARVVRKAKKANRFRKSFGLH